MKKSFKEFWRSYFALCKESLKWMKAHWKGYIILCIVAAFVGATIGYLNAQLITQPDSKEDVE